MLFRLVFLAGFCCGLFSTMFIVCEFVLFVVGREVVRFVYVFCFLGCGRVVLFVVGGVVSMIVFSCGVSDFFVVVSVVCCGVWSFVLCGAF